MLVGIVDSEPLASGTLSLKGERISSCGKMQVYAEIIVYDNLFKQGCLRQCHA